MSKTVEHNGTIINLDKDFYSDVPVTCYELTFTGTVGRQRKDRRHTITIDSVVDNGGVLMVSKGGVVTQPENILASEGAKRGTWALQSYVGKASRWQHGSGDPDGEIMRSMTRQLFDNSLKKLATGKLGE